MVRGNSSSGISPLGVFIPHRAITRPATASERNAKRFSTRSARFHTVFPAKVIHLVSVQPKQASGLHFDPLGFLERRLNPASFEGFHLFLKPDAGGGEAESLRKTLG